MLDYGFATHVRLLIFELKSQERCGALTCAYIFLSAAVVPSSICCVFCCSSRVVILNSSGGGERFYLPIIPRNPFTN